MRFTSRSALARIAEVGVVNKVCGSSLQARATTHYHGCYSSKQELGLRIGGTVIDGKERRGTDITMHLFISMFFELNRGPMVCLKGELGLDHLLGGVTHQTRPG